MRGNRPPDDFFDSVVQGDAVEVLRELPDSSVALAVTSPPYWDIVDYKVEGQYGRSSYKKYIDDLLRTWKATKRVLIPNGKLAIVTPVMPIPKKVIDSQHTRHLKNINADIEHSIVSQMEDLYRYSLFIWQKQTTTKMFGSYPYPPNLYEDNTIEFVTVFVKAGKPEKVPAPVKESSKITQEEWRNLTMQVWPIYPDDVRRDRGHPCPFPVALPQRLIKMYTFASSPEHGFEGDLVLDMFNGSGTTCVAARGMHRRYLGIDLNEEYCEIARNRLVHERVDEKAIYLSEPTVKQAENRDQMTLF